MFAFINLLGFFLIKGKKWGSVLDAFFWKPSSTGWREAVNNVVKDHAALFVSSQLTVCLM